MEEKTFTKGTIKTFKPVGSKVLLTKEKYNPKDNTNSSKIYTSYSQASGEVKEYQKVVAVGNYVKNFKEGDIVAIDVEKYCPRNFQENSIKEDIVTMKRNLLERIFPTRIVDGKEYLLLNESDIEGIVTF